MNRKHTHVPELRSWPVQCKHFRKPTENGCKLLSCLGCELKKDTCLVPKRSFSVPEYPSHLSRASLKKKKKKPQWDVSSFLHLFAVERNTTAPLSFLGTMNKLLQQNSYYPVPFRVGLSKHNSQCHEFLIKTVAPVSQPWERKSVFTWCFSCVSFFPIF